MIVDITLSVVRITGEISRRVVPNSVLMPKFGDGPKARYWLRAEYIDEPIPGYLRLKVADQGWLQDGQIITLARTDIDRLQIIDTTKEKMEISAIESSNGAVAAGSRETLIEIDQPAKKDGRETQ